jgi:hypothetical protein
MPPAARGDTRATAPPEPPITLREKRGGSGKKLDAFLGCGEAQLLEWSITMNKDKRIRNQLLKGGQGCQNI